MCLIILIIRIFFFNDTAPTEIYTLSLHDALPICRPRQGAPRRAEPPEKGGPRKEGRPYRLHRRRRGGLRARKTIRRRRSEEHTSELQSRQYLVCRLLLEKKQTSD